MGTDIMKFLKETNNRFSYDIPVTVVMGNEAADLDSMVSAVCYAWYLHLVDPSGTIIPLINIPRADFKLRTEAVFLFKEAGIDLDSLFFADDIDLAKLKESGNLKLVLVDHNKLSSGQMEFEDAITEVLDHHADEKSYPQTAGTDIRPVGSCATIVAESFLKEDKNYIDAPLGTLLLGTILLDTVNLDPEAGRVTEADSRAAEEIIAVSGLERENLFEKLQFEKFNVASLESYDLLRKDYKEWILGNTRLGIGSVLLPVADWIAKDPEIIDSFNKYRTERDIDVLLSMNAFTSPEFTRQLIVYIPDAALNRDTVSFLENSDLGLEKIETEVSSDGCTFYNQKNLGISRKKLQPLLKEFFEGLG